jgi:hypothetical protein
MSILLFYSFVSIDIQLYPNVYPCISDILSIYILQFILSYPVTSYHILFCIHLNLLSYPFYPDIYPFVFIDIRTFLLLEIRSSAPLRLFSMRELSTSADHR